MINCLRKGKEKSFTNQIFYKENDVRHKKWDSAEPLTFVNLKSNTMKNTLQRYYIFWDLQENTPTK